MAQREYKQMSCRDLGADCDFLVRAEKEDEVIALISEHVCRVHGRCEIPTEMKDKVRVPMKSVYCEGECYDASRMTWHSCWGPFCPNVL